MKNRAETSGIEQKSAPPAGGQGFVRLEGVSKRFGDVVALHEATLDVRRGEILTLLGPSGGGKTTLLNLVAGFLLPDSGAIHIAGQPVTGVPPYRREIGVRLEDRRPRQLSGGQQQRVALARALAISPKVLLLDEPFSALDKNLRGSMQLELKEIQRKLGVTTIFVTHDQSEALSLSDRIVVLSEGRIRQVGTPGEIYRRPTERFVASFVGDVNVLRARLEEVDGEAAQIAIGAAKLAVPAGTLRGCAPGAPVELFIRPEQLRLAETGTRPPARVSSRPIPIRAVMWIFT